MAEEANQEGAQIRDDLLDKGSKGVDGALELGDVCAEESSHAVFVNHLYEQPEARLSTEQHAKGLNTGGRERDGKDLANFFRDIAEGSDGEKVHSLAVCELLVVECVCV